ncbi:hypothetical protein CSC70_00450 [Pseudoxanthomonas kalamensis DSM 18571]|uniref:DUF481 domain-containing protein n=1 Tax=Pseudoxanthomonas kalamensis TaxID=289483 RepID=UPI0013912C7E|nr:DUF481 domain-containing protein [Pseudoxanthomonas kalamensis]KAF1712040.1 hypothetical protein CSC70_00450 [Pseudoxanthomonas kalamensis DSM 18571]
MRQHLVLALLAAMAAPAIAQAEDTQDWSGQGELGLAVSKGNTDSSTLVGKLNLGKEAGRWKNAFGASFLYGEQDDVESAYRYELYGTSGYRLGDRSYLFGSLRNERDHFTANEYQWTAAFGYGYEAIKNDATHLTFEIGPGYRWAKLQDVQIHNNEAVLRGFMDFGHQLTETTSIYDTLLIEAGSDNTYAKNDLGLQVQMTEALALKAGLEVRHNTDVLPGTKKTDSLTTLNVVYGF